MERTMRLGQMAWIAAVALLLFGHGPQLSACHADAALGAPAGGGFENFGGASGQARRAGDDAQVICANETPRQSKDDPPACLPSEGFACAELWAEFLRIPPYYYGVTRLLWKDKDAFVQFVTSEWEIFLWRDRSGDE